MKIDTNYNFRILLLFAWFVNILQLNAQPNLYKFQHLTIEDGLSQNTVNAIVQDNKGFIWLGTGNGLNRYDGYRFEEFSYQMNDTSSLSNNQIKVLLEDAKGRLWVGTEGGGLNRYNPETQNFKRYYSIEKDSGSLCSNDITAIFEDKAGTLWVGTRSGLNKYIEHSDNFKQFKHTASNANGLSSNHITAIHTNSKNHIWIATYGGGLNKLSVKDETFQVFKKEKENTLNDNIVWSVYEDSAGVVWIGTESGALNVFNTQTNTWKYFGYEKEIISSLGDNLVRAIEPGLNGDLWIGSDGGGIYQLNHGKTRYFKEYKNNISQPFSLGSNSISTLYKDKSDLLWLGLVDGGVDRTNLKQEPFYNLSHSLNDKRTLCNSQINYIFQDSQGKFWIGTEGGLNLGNSELNSFEYFFEHYNNPNTINNNVVLTVAEISNGEIWLGTYLGGINIYNKTSKKFRYLTHNDENKHSLPSNFVRAIYEDLDGKIWVGTIRGGLCTYRQKTNDFEKQLLFKDGIELPFSDYVMKILGDKKSNIYVATYGGGLYIIDTHTRNTHSISSGNSDETLSSNQLISMTFDSDSNLWIGTAYGLNKYNTNTRKIEKYYKSDGLPDDYINALVVDTLKQLWISTNKGLSVYDRELKRFKNFTKHDGILSSEFNFNSGMLGTNGQLYFGGNKGLSYFDPGKIVEHKKALHVHFTELFINNKEVKVGEKFSNNIVLHKPIYDCEKLNLTYREDNFSLYFSTMEYAYTQKVKYRYKLDSKANEYIYLEGRNFISFHNQSPGLHKLYVEASLSDFINTPETTVLTIYIEPPFWEKIWFKIVVSFVFIAFILLIYYLRISTIKKQKKVLEQMVYEKTKDLHETNVLLEENQAELEMQHEELMSQRDLANVQNEKISSQNEELIEHRQNLEKLIRIRTEELYLAKIKAEKADELKTSFLANMSHEIRTPMNAILGFLEILDDPIYSAEERMHFKSLINNSGQVLLTLINDIIDIAKIESGQVDVSKVDFELTSIFKELDAIYSKNLKENNLNFELILELPDSCIINSDDLRIKQVLINMLNNAFKFTEKGQVKFGFYVENEQVICFVKDTGIGMPEDAYLHIFDRFRKIETGNDKLYRGTGLGLAISKNLIELLDGKIWVESQLQKGSTFYFSLPIKK